MLEFRNCKTGMALMMKALRSGGIARNTSKWRITSTYLQRNEGSIIHTNREKRDQVYILTRKWGISCTCFPQKRKKPPWAIHNACPWQHFPATEKVYQYDSICKLNCVDCHHSHFCPGKMSMYTSNWGASRMSIYM